MAELTDFLTNIADAIRKKTSKTDKIRASDFASEIENISTGEGLDTSLIRQTQNMFRNNKDLIEAPLFDTSNVTNMNSMFVDCSSLNYVPSYDTSNVINMNSMFSKCYELLRAPLFDTSNVTNFGNIFNGCSKLEYVPKYDTSKASDLNNMFNGCSKLKEIPLLNCDNVIIINRIFIYCNKLENIGGLENLGKAYKQKTENYQNYELLLSSSNSLTHESLMNVINNLYDLNLTYNVAEGGILYKQKLNLGATNKAKLTEEEIQIAINKGWNVV